MMSGHDETGPATLTTNTHVQNKRSRIQLSCTACRHAKLKCDRGHPCNQCVKRNRSSQCLYPVAPVRQRPLKSMQGRLNHLESLVIGMMNDQPLKSVASHHGSAIFNKPVTSHMQEAASPNGQDSASQLRGIQSELIEEQSAPGFEMDSGQILLGVDETAYVGATHWAAILEDIEEVKGYFNDATDEDFDQDSEWHTAAMALGKTTPASKADLLTALPGRSVVDRLVSRYFNSNDPAMVIIHKPTFQKEYQEFWTEPSSMPVMWIGLLYAMLCLASLYSLGAGDELLASPEQVFRSARKYSSLCAQSLMLANYFKPGAYTMEALVLHFLSEFVQSEDNVTKCWVLNGMTIRLALRMGYHRDAKHHKNISIFHGEMRRRMWHVLAPLDLLLSFQVGLPSMMRAIQSDTALPHNLLDDDFYQNSPELPPARPESEATPLSYMIYKSRICNVVGIIIDHANSILSPVYSEVLDLDTRLREVYNLVPSFLLTRPLDQSITENSSLLMQRFNLALLFHKNLCVLHRKYLTKECMQDQYLYSRISCIDSALELLRFQSTINDALQTGGPLSRDRWYLTTIAAHDFLLGAMIIYLTLISGLASETIGKQSNNGLEPKITQEVKLYQQLELSYNIWKSSPREARDIIKATRVLEIMVRNVRQRLFSESHENLTSQDDPSIGIEELHFSVGNINGSAHVERVQFDSIPCGQMDDLGIMINMPDRLDWELWDNHINTSHVDNPDFFWTSDMDPNQFTLAEDVIAMEEPEELQTS